jgi:twinkle protein
VKLVPDHIDLREYMKAPEFALKVRPASDFLDEVQEMINPVDMNKPQAPAMLSPKFRGLRFRPGEITCWAGYNGHRKSMFTSQMILELCLQRERALIVSLEMAPASTMARMAKQATGLLNPPRHAVREFHRWTDDRLWLFDHVGRLDAATAVGLCRYFAHELQGKHIVLDSMMKLCKSEESMDEQKAFITSLCEVAQETGLHVHLVVHCRKPPGSGDETKPPSKYDIKGTGAISDQAHNVVTVWANKAKGDKLEANPGDIKALAEPDALITCEKQRNGPWEGRLKYWFDEGSMRFLDDRVSSVEPYVFGSNSAKETA